MKVEKHSNIKEFNRFARQVYGDEPGFVDNKSSLVKLLCRTETAFFNNSKQQMVWVKENNEILCQAVLIKHHMAHELSIGFFDATPNAQKAVTLLLEYAEALALSWNVDRVVIGLEGHCNNAVGFPLNPHLPISFGESYGKAYYHDFFLSYEQIKLVSFKKEIAAITGRLRDDIRRIEHRTKGVTLEPADFSSKGFRKSIQRYTDLNNRIFEDHRYYYQRSAEEDLELFSSMKPLLNANNLIFAKKDGEDIGFVLWYPDFNQLVPVGGTAGVLTFIRYKVLRQIPRRGKLVEIGLIPKFKRTGAVALLFLGALEAAGQKCTTMITSWILEENMPSELATQRYADEPYKEYCTYEKNLSRY
ncbi:MAG: hypothetical protein H6Q49_1706 [Deltaproteobacteria bacterium]|nr:hypothetical protein [Deltaproteobacteria bacterium]